MSQITVVQARSPWDLARSPDKPWESLNNYITLRVGFIVTSLSICVTYHDPHFKHVIVDIFHYFWLSLFTWENHCLKQKIKTKNCTKSGKKNKTKILILDHLLEIFTSPRFLWKCLFDQQKTFFSLRHSPLFMWKQELKLRSI